VNLLTKIPSFGGDEFFIRRGLVVSGVFFIGQRTPGFSRIGLVFSKELEKRS
jgi:hypothetical protein